MVGIVEDVPLQIGNAKIPINMRVAETTKETILLGMDWHKKYQAIMNTPKSTLSFVVNGQSYTTYIEYQNENTVYLTEWVEEREEEESCELT